MAKTYYKIQSSLEEKAYKIDWTDALPSGVTVTALTVTHTPPSGADATFTNDVSAAPITWTYAPSGLAVGKHQVSIVATTSNASISPEVRLIIDVGY